MAVEMVNIFDNEQNHIGIADRSAAHRKGLLHDVVHCWIVDPRKEGRIFFQQRAMSKETFPGYFDIAVGGHISAGEAPQEAILREICEEVGLHPDPSQLIFVGNVRKSDYISEGMDREIGRVFLYLCAQPQFEPGDEVDGMVYISIPKFLRRFDTPSITAHSIDGEKLEIMLDQWAGFPSREFEDYILPHLTPYIMPEK